MLLLVMACTMLACSGSNKAANTVVTNYPTFWEKVGGVESISLAPMENTTQSQGVESGVRTDILQRLKSNEWPKIHDRQGYLSGDEVEMLAQERQLGGGSGTRLILFATLNDYRTKESSETRSIPLNILIGSNPIPYTWTKNEGSVAISVRLINIDTGEMILTQNFKGDCLSEGNPPDLLLSACFEKARDEAISDLITAVRVTDKTIKLERNDLRTAKDFDPDNGWMYSDKFSLQQEEFLAVVRLPSSANLNEFIVDVVVRGRKESVVSHEFTWDGANETSGYAFSPKEIATEGAGLRTYTLRLIQKDGMKILLTHDFKITK